MAAIEALPGCAVLRAMPGLDQDAPLLERLRRGDLDAVGDAYDKHNDAVRAFARRLVGEEHAAEDLVHEVFVSLPSAMNGFRGGSSLRTFLISIAVNHARHHLRSVARRRAAMEVFAMQPTNQPRDPEEQARMNALATALGRALDDLPLDQRVAFILCDVEERTSTEAAEITGAPEATIRTRLFQARRKLRAALGEEFR